jgi:protein transport protein SEC24
MIVFQSSLPSLGVAALKNREGTKPSTDKELALLRPADQFYKNLALDCSRQQISVDLFLMPPGYVDVPTLSCMPQFTGGQTFYYPPGELQQKIEKLRRDLAHSLTRTQGFEAVMRVRCGKGLRVQTHFGNHFIKSTDLLALPNIDSDKAFGIQLELTDGLASLKHISLQAALLYTSTTGERRIRAMNVCLPVTSQLSDIYKFCDTDAIVNLTAKMGKFTTSIILFLCFYSNPLSYSSLSFSYRESFERF